MIPEWFTPWPFLIAGIAVFLLVSHLRAKKRTKLLKQAVTRLGLKFHEGSHLDEFTDERFKFFKLGNTPMLANLITGRWENLDLKIADYDYSTGHGRHSKHYSPETQR